MTPKEKDPYILFFSYIRHRVSAGDNVEQFGGKFKFENISKIQNAFKYKLSMTTKKDDIDHPNPNE